MALKKIDLNADVGESFGKYKLGMDADIIPLISSANIACGFHAGDPKVMKLTIQVARENGVALGAHPGFPDLMGFGRRNMDLTLAEIQDYVTYQIGALQAFAVAQGAKLQHVKPHGALYNQAVQNLQIWDAIAESVAAIDPSLILFVQAGPWRPAVESIGRKHGIRLAFEFFGDREYNADGSLVSRKKTGAVIHDPHRVVEKVLRMVSRGTIISQDGVEFELSAETICVHGDNPSALNMVVKIRETLTDQGIQIAAPDTFL
jgi:UPF0271 protein